MRIHNRGYVLFILVPLGLMIAFLVWFLFTPSGAKTAAQVALSMALGARDVSFQKVRGRLAQEAFFEDVRVFGFKSLPPESEFVVQRLSIQIPWFWRHGFGISIFNGRLRVGESPILSFQGAAEKDSLDFNVYGQNVNLNYLARFFASSGQFNNMEGTLETCDLFLKGTVAEPVMKGELKITELTYEKFSLVRCPVVFHVAQRASGGPFGDITIRSGSFSRERSATVHLEESKIFFQGDFKNPRFDIHGTTRVGNTSITIVLQGSMTDPQLRLTSEPPLPQGRLLAMVVTGQAWQGFEESISQGQVSSDLIRDFVDYFLLGGVGNRLSNEYGLDLSVDYSKQKQGIGVRKSITDTATATYKIEQTTDEEQQQQTKTTVGGQLQVSDGLSVGVEQEIQQQDPTTADTQEKQDPNSTVFFKYEKKF